MDKLPVELLHVIAAVDEGAYRGLLGITAFARSLSRLRRAEYRVRFGYSVERKRRAYVKYYKNGRLHRAGDLAALILHGEYRHCHTGYVIDGTFTSIPVVADKIWHVKPGFVIKIAHPGRE